VLSVADLDRVALVLEEFPGPSCALTRIGEADRLEGPEPHLARAAVEGEAEHPRLTVRGADLQIEAAAVGVVAYFACVLDS
jgi:hypothetical protein